MNDEIITEQVKSILSRMTLEEKIAIASGADFWKTKEYPEYGIPELFLCDGPHGLRRQDVSAGTLGVGESVKATCFPAEVTTACSWDQDLVCEIGAAIAEEAKNQKVGLVLGPGANLKRNPLCGRNFEYFSEDPFLAGKMAAAFIRGAEKKGVGTSLKHFACNNQELDRFTSSSVLDERTLRELYLTAFEIAVKEGKPSTVMCAYPRFDGVPCSNSEKLLKEILREEWGFEGAVITDWGAMSNRIEAFRVGCDLSMPGGSAYMEDETAEAVRAGTLPEADVDACAARVVELVLRCSKAMTGEFCDYDAHHRLSEAAAVSGAVLLKNDGNILPLDRKKKIAVIGQMAEHMRYQGSGSSRTNAAEISQPLHALTGCRYARGCDENGDTTEELLQEAEILAKSSDVAVVFAGLPGSLESEGFDRADMRMPDGHIQMIERVAGANPYTIVVLFSGSVLECSWADRVKGILYMGLPGEAGGSAAGKLLFGEANPSGKLAESWPYRYEDVPSSEIFGKTKDGLYEEGLYVGYRYYEKAGIPVRWPFGYGLSYTEFSCSDLRKDGDMIKIRIKNTGEREGAEVLQLFVEAPQNGVYRPVRELKGFAKVHLAAGEEKEVTFSLNERSFSVWQDGWKKPEGDYRICVGGCSLSVFITGDKIEVPAWQAGSWYENPQGKPLREEWEKMLGKKYVPSDRTQRHHFTMEDTIEEMSRKSLTMWFVRKFVESAYAKRYGKKDYHDPEFRMLINSSIGAPLRSSYISSGKKSGLFPGLLLMANGHFFRGLYRIMKG